MGYVFDFRDAWLWERVIEQPRQRLRLERENRLLLDMLCPHPGDSLLEIGCGIGATLAALKEEGLRLAGIDASPHMLDIARQRTGRRVEYYQGWAEDLPFDDNAFHYAVFAGALEFFENPQRAVEEAGRVAKDKVFIGAVNKYAVRAMELRIRGIFASDVFNRARFFSIWELKRMIRRAAGDVPLLWRTTGSRPWNSKMGVWFDRALVGSRYPFGSYAAVAATMTPRFRTRPLALEFRLGSERPSGAPSA